MRMVLTDKFGTKLQDDKITNLIFKYEFKSWKIIFSIFLIGLIFITIGIKTLTRHIKAM